MVTIEILREITGLFPLVNEAPHFEKISFRIGNKIFVTYDNEKNQTVLKLSEIDQNVFSQIAKGVVNPVQNNWDKQGCTTVEMDKVMRDLFFDLIKTAYCTVAKKYYSDIISSIKQSEQ